MNITHTGIIALSAFFITAFIILAGCEHEPFEPIVEELDENPIDTTLNCFEDTVYYKEDIQPIIDGNCSMSDCHDAVTKSDGIDLSSYDRVINTGEIKPMDPDGSEFYTSLSNDNTSE